MKNFKLLLTMGFFGLLGCHQKAKEQNSDETPNAVETNQVVEQIIFGEEVSFNYSDFEDLENNKSYDQFEIGALNTPSGQIVCTDPMYRELGLPQSWSVKPGQYPVNIYIGLEEDFQGRVAYAEITFSESVITEWKMSLISETLLKDEFEKKMNGMYPVENGLGSFSDYTAWKNYCHKVKEFYKNDPEGNFYLEELEPLFKANEGSPKSSRGEDWVNYKINSNENMIMFGSGWGDGLYPRYVGYDENGKAVKLITDFIQLEYIED